ncbi:P-loop containing nucleoside triphosphate hydrolase protein [Tothia fuscella]|uniref:ATP-dependent RNA helicase n=1 Tax=Tothia fuscella TaxID=1048955 RepID=A0A9P4NTN5_9PEZI|nr:P-loop containing nucleoside triphosphate hydrolase protein [Tothia fuscella]
MSAPPYARYIPPKTPGTTITLGENAAQDIHKPSSTTPKLYNRYVPPKVSAASIEAPNFSSSTKESSVSSKVTLGQDKEGKLDSKKRKRTKDVNVHDDRKRLIEHGYLKTEALEKDSQIPRNGEKSKVKKEKRDKRDKKEEKLKLRSLEVADGNTAATAIGSNEEMNGNGPRNIELVDSIVSKYSVTNGAHRESRQASQNHQDDAEEGMEMDMDMDRDIAEEALDKPEVDTDEEITKAGVEAIFQKYRRTTQLAEAGHRKSKQNREEGASAPESEPELHGLEPLPQPAITPKVAYKPTFDSLPSWLARPIIVSPTASLPFSEFSLSNNIISNLHRKDYDNALAIQSGVLPLLLPGPQKYHGDLCVSAPTGSGKTIAYVLPMVQELKQKIVTRLRGIIIVPTRELVTQAHEVAKLCAAGTGIKIETAVGSVPLSVEQARLISKGQKYDPLAAKVMHDEAQERLRLGCGLDDALLQDVTKLLPHHVPEYNSNVDILICTPGRLVDHIRTTIGFSLAHVDWLVIDEADKLLDESFQDWVEVLLNALHPLPSADLASARQKVLANLNIKLEPPRVRKIILSATMTRDLSKLASLKFESPVLVAIADDQSLDAEIAGTAEDVQSRTHGDSFLVPVSLTEIEVPVWVDGDKPLYMLRLLQQELLAPGPRYSKAQPNSGSASLPVLDSGSDSDTTSNSNEISGSSNEPDRKHARDEGHVLIFTRDNESATRLKHLLSILHPPLQSVTETLTKSSATSDGRKTLKAFQSGRIKILIASDRASRGLDVADLTHVVNYDMPRSVTSYIHRVGRTARAGKPGKAWTLFTRRESKFWKTITGGSEVQRGGRSVERVKIDIDQLDDAKRGEYQEALEKLHSAVQGKGGV